MENKLGKKVGILNLIVTVVILFLLNTIRFQNQIDPSGIYNNFQNYFLRSLVVALLVVWAIMKSIYIIKNRINQKRWILISEFVFIWGLIFGFVFENLITEFGFLIVYLAALGTLFFQMEMVFEPGNQIKNHKSALWKKLTSILILTILFSVFGSLIIQFDASLLCTSFPFCFDSVAADPMALLVMGHRILIAIVFLLLVELFIYVWKFLRHETAFLTTVTSMLVLFIGQGFLGAYQTFHLFPVSYVLLHSFSNLGFMASLSLSWWIALKKNMVEKNYQNHIFNDEQRRKDFLRLNKPIIVVLLLVITYAGMIIGAEKIPPFWLTFWTLIAGALAAGGASAINQYIDREIDQSMQRTSKRPIPSGRLLPAEALALGFSELIISFFIYVFFVNMISALLALAGMIYYIVVYSLWLKHATVQNIVIGGGAGAIPPLVGWAAATGGLNIPSLFLFAIVFLWTPPHFWALALIRKNDYARAKVPMLPVIKGEKTTKTQILIYTIELVLLTMLMPFFNVGGSVYLILAVLLGAWILSAAWKVFKQDGNKVAYKMYRYSSMYLAFIFFALVIDVLI